MLCRDTWKRRIPPEKLSAYKQLLDEGVINNIHVTFARAENVTIFEYDSDKPHEWILAELAKRAEVTP